MSGLTVKAVMEEFIEAGLGAIPGGGAEIFAEEKRSIIAPGKISGKRWLEIMKTAHGLGLKTNATLLYNHIEDAHDIVDHMLRLRNLQDEPGGFQDLRTHSVPRGEYPDQVQEKAEHGLRRYQLYATARKFLHKFPHIKGPGCTWREEWPRPSWASESMISAPHIITKRLCIQPGPQPPMWAARSTCGDS
jgi:aminodeoxyfutalosine synthase